MAERWIEARILSSRLPTPRLRVTFENLQSQFTLKCIRGDFLAYSRGNNKPP
jgi:hypothetical protein